VAHAAHCYIYVDNDNRFLDTVRHELEGNYGFSTQEVSLFHALAVVTQKTPPQWLVVADFYEPWPNYTFRALAREGGPAIRNLYERNRRYRQER